MKNLQQNRKDFILNKVIRYPEGTMTRQEWLKLMKVKGWTAEETKLRNYAAEEKLTEDLWRRKMNVPLGNPNYPTTKAYLEDKAKLAAGIYKTEYCLRMGNSSYEITKTEFDYFNSLN